MTPPPVVSEIVVHRVVTVTVPPPDGGYERENPRWPWEPCVWHAHPCDPVTGRPGDAL